MKKIITLLLLLPLFAMAQKETFDIITYTAPAGWTKQRRENLIVFSKTDKFKKTWGQLSLVKSTISKGSIESDFESEWNILAAQPYSITEAPQSTDIQEAEGWKIKTGIGKFTFNNGPAIAMVTTISGFGRCVSVVATMNTDGYMDPVQKFLESLDLKKPAAAKETPANGNNNGGNISGNDPGTGNSQRNDGFKFSTTNFDDGWNSTVKEDWVEVTKDNMKVLLHYPKDGTIFPADPDPLVRKAWDILVAPRYSNLKNFRTAYITMYNRPVLGMGYATENSTGKEVFVVFFNQYKTWIEFVAPDKETFIKYFKIDPETIQWDTDSDKMNPLASMTVYNKFAVAASDFKGKWTSDFSGIQQMYNVYTGNYAGMHINQSNEEFVFSGNSYTWKLLVINGMAGNSQFNQVKSAGTFSVPNNWQLQCSKIEKGPKLYNAFWSCIKGARILNLIDAQYPGSGIYTQYGLAK